MCCIARSCQWRVALNSEILLLITLCGYLALRLKRYARVVWVKSLQGSRFNLSAPVGNSGIRNDEDYEAFETGLNSDC
jgi:hypothetical protein